MNTKPMLRDYAARVTPAEPAEQREHHPSRHHRGITATTA